MLVLGDNLEFLRGQPEGSFDLAICDPPYRTQMDWREFDDRWRPGEYEQYMRDRLFEIHRVLKSNGTVYVMCDHAADHILRTILNDAFGADHFLAAIARRRSGHRASAKNRWAASYDVIFHYARGDNWTWDPPPCRTIDEKRFNQQDWRGRYQGIDLTGPGVKRGTCGLPWRDIDPAGKGRHWQIPAATYGAYERQTGKKLLQEDVRQRLDALYDAGLVIWKEGGVPRAKLYLEDAKAPAPTDFWDDVANVNRGAGEYTGYPTQKPEALLERIILASSRPRDVVLDPWCGSGTTLAVAQRLGRRWVGIDQNPRAIEICRRRLWGSVESLPPRTGSR
jgi:DNA modification methylase